MLTSLTRKLCPLMTLAIATLGCGKKIADTEAQPARQTENQELPSAYVIRLDGSEASRKNYKLPRNARFEIPDLLKVRAGTTANKIVEIAYEVNEFDGDDFQFKCSYVASSNPAEMKLKACVDYDANDLGDVTGHTFGLHFNDIIQIRFTGAPSSDLVVDAIYSMRWI